MNVIAHREERAGTFTEHAREAIELLTKALDESPERVGEDVDIAERHIAWLRDRLIDALRNDAAEASASGGRREALGRVNVALSLVVGVEYPLAGIHRGPMKQARDVLQQVVDSGVE